jgi:hypothetical protein
METCERRLTRCMVLISAIMSGGSCHSCRKDIEIKPSKQISEPLQHPRHGARADRIGPINSHVLETKLQGPWLGWRPLSPPSLSKNGQRCRCFASFIIVRPVCSRLCLVSIDCPWLKLLVIVVIAAFSCFLRRPRAPIVSSSCGLDTKSSNKL